MTYSGVIGITPGGSEVTNGGAITSGANTYSIGSNNNVYLTMTASNAVDVSASSSTYGPVVSSVPPAPTLTSFTCTATTITPTFTASTGNVTTTYKAIIGITSGGSEVTNGGAITSGANTYSIGSNNFVYLTIYGNNSRGDGPVSTRSGPIISSAPPAPSVSATQANVTQTTVGSIALSAAGNANCNSAFKVSIGTTNGGSELYGPTTGLSTGFTPVPTWTAVGSNNLIYVTAYASNSNGFGLGATVSYPSTVPPAPTVSGLSATATTITATLSVSGNAPTTYKVILGDATTNSTTLSNVTGPTDISSGSAATVAWGGPNKCYYATFIGSNAAGLGVLSTSTFLANWTPSVSVTSSSAVQDGTSVSFVFADQPTTNGLTYTDIRLGTTAGAADIRAAQALTAGTQAGTQTFSISATARPYTVYITATAAAGSTKTSTGSNSYTILGYPLRYNSTTSGNLSNITATNSRVAASNWTNAAVTAYMTVDVMVTAIYQVSYWAGGGAQPNISSWSQPATTGIGFYSFNPIGVQVVMANAGGSIYVNMQTATSQPSGSVGIEVIPHPQNGTNVLPTGGTIILPEPSIIFNESTTTGAWRVHVFTSNGNFVTPFLYSAKGGGYNIIVIGGGAGAGCGEGANAGGGGAGGLAFVKGVSIPGNTTCTISLGAGGGGSINSSFRGVSGGSSTFTVPSLGVITANGGGGGGSSRFPQGTDGANGGGGAARGSGTSTGGSSVSPQGSCTISGVSSANYYGNNGGTGSSDGAGGGGAGGAGGMGTLSSTGEYTGGGLGVNIFGSLYACGGGGWGGAGQANGTGNGGGAGYGGGGSGGGGAVIIYYHP
jgi:hypothetical protein